MKAFNSRNGDKLTRAVLALLCGLPAAALAAVDDVEGAFGATNVSAALGDGQMAVGVAKSGELTVLRWPGPGSPDQVRYITHADRTLPRLGATPQMGVFFGLVEDGAATWLRDAPWKSSQAWAGEGSPVLVTSFDRESGPKVEQRDFVVWKKNILVRHLRLTGLTGHVRVVAYGALAPCGFRSSEVPFDDWAWDEPRAGGPVDFALFYSPSDTAMVHFRPDKDRVESLRDTAQAAVARAEAGPAAAQKEISALDDAFGDGSFFAWGAAATGPTGFTAAQLAWPGRPAGLAPAPFEDAADGELSGNLAAVAPAAGALSFELTPVNGQADLVLVLTAGSSAAQALGALAEARAKGLEALRRDTEQGWAGLVSKLTMPSTDDARIRATSKRAIMNIVTATDAASGSIVASITTQPPYAENWPRDSAFLNYALERAGLPELATANNRFLARVQRRSDQPGRPAGSFAMNYYSDGRPGGPIPFEIDNTAFAVWTFCEHGDYLDTLGRRADAKAYREEIYPAVKRGADLLTRCRSDDGLQCPANEDDHFETTQTLHGASAVLLALESAARAAQIAQEPGDAAAWITRAAELKAAILKTLVDPDGMLVGERGARAWALWPAGVFDSSDPRVDLEADRMLDDLEAQLAKHTEGSFYDAKLTSALASVLPATGPRRERLKAVINTMLVDLPTSTGAYGEVFVSIDTDGDGQKDFDNRVAMPHVWEGTLNYLAALQFYGERPADRQGCGCSETNLGSLWVSLALAGLFRRFRRGTPAG